MLSKNSVEFRNMDFYTIGINKLISHWQNVLMIVMVPILTKKDVFEPSYNDLKNHGLKLQLLFQNLRQNPECPYIQKKSEKIHAPQIS